MKVTTQEKIHRIWDELSDFEAGQSDLAATHLMEALCNLGNAWNATWGGATRLGGDYANDPLQGWRVAAMRLLHPIPSHPDEGPFKEILRLWDRREIDLSFLLPMQGVGTFRAYSFRKDLPPEWFESPFYRHHYGAVGTCDSVFIGFPLNQDAESHFGFHSRKTFTDQEIGTLTYAMRGLKWFHRQLMLSHGLLMASSPLTPAERKVLQLLMTEFLEKQIADQLGLATSTTHQHVIAIFRKFGVRSRAGLMSLWLNRGG